LSSNVHDLESTTKKGEEIGVEGTKRSDRKRIVTTQKLKPQKKGQFEGLTYKRGKFGEGSDPGGGLNGTSLPDKEGGKARGGIRGQKVRTKIFKNVP